MGKIKHKILKGEVYFRLTVMTDVYRNKIERVVDVKCKCGAKKTVAVRKLAVGKIKSCGCLQKEKASICGKNSILPDGEAAFNKILSSYKGAATKRKLKWDLTKEEFREIIKKNCHYCDEVPSKTRKSHNGAEDYISNGADRVDNSVGYTKENVVPCCTFCNKAKSVHSKEYFIQKCKEIIENEKSTF